MAKTILEQFRFIVKVIRLCSKVCGADGTDPEYRMNYLTGFVIVMICFFILSTFYTIYATIVANDDWSVLLQILCMAGSGVQGASKLFSGLAYRHNIGYMLNELDLIYANYEKKRDDYKCALQKSVNLLRNISIIIGCAYIAICCGLVTSALYLRIFQNRTEFCLHFLVPGINTNTNEGFVMLNGIHFICLLLGCFGNFAGDMYFITFTTHMPLLKDILQHKFEDLNIIVENQNNNFEKSTELLKDIIAWHQKFMSFIAILKKAYFWVITVQIITISNSIACTLFCLLLGKWTIGLVYLIYCFIMLYIYCGLGTLVEIANDGFIQSCYNDSLWYKYSVKDQKTLKLMLRMSQNTKGLSIGSVYPLSVSTALQVTKTIYTFTMMLMNFLD